MCARGVTVLYSKEDDLTFRKVSISESGAQAQGASHPNARVRSNNRQCRGPAIVDGIGFKGKLDGEGVTPIYSSEVS